MVLLCLKVGDIMKFDVKLPCSVGDTLYRLDIDPNMPDHVIEPYCIDNIVLRGDGDVLFKYDAFDGIICDLKSLITGEPYLDYYKVFLTWEQADAARKALLKKCDKEGKNALWTD